MAANALEVRDLHKVFKADILKRRVTALQSVSFTVKEGEIFGFVGHNGAGKTTSLKIVVGLIFADSGSVSIFGRDTGHPGARQPLGYLPEQPYFYDYLTPTEALRFYGGLSGIPRRTLAQRIPQVLSEVNLEFAAHRAMRGFSKGMLQRLGMAQALVHDPKLLILDEPMSGLDPVGRKLMRDIILRQREQGRTVCFSSHVLSDVEDICDRVGIVIRGQMRAEGDVQTLLGPPDRIQVVVRDLTPEKERELEGFGALTKRGETWQLTATDLSRQGDLMNWIKARQVNLLEFGTRRKTLEELFVEAMNTN